MRIVDFQPQFAPAFKALNEAWIRRHFELEAKDEEILGDPAGQVISRGGAIFFALEDDEPLGCCALIPMDDGGFELSKMAVDPTAQGKGFAKALIEACAEHARAAGAPRLYLESGSKLTPALTLYRTMGFRDLAPERRPVSPYARADVWMELTL